MSNSHMKLQFNYSNIPIERYLRRRIERNWSKRSISNTPESYQIPWWTWWTEQEVRWSWAWQCLAVCWVCRSIRRLLVILDYMIRVRSSHKQLQMRTNVSRQVVETLMHTRWSYKCWQKETEKTKTHQFFRNDCRSLLVDRQVLTWNGKSISDLAK